MRNFLSSLLGGLAGAVKRSPSLRRLAARNPALRRRLLQVQGAGDGSSAGSSPVARPKGPIPVPHWAAPSGPGAWTPPATPSDTPPLPAAAAGGVPGRLRPTPAQERDIARAAMLVRRMLGEGEALLRRSVLMERLKEFGLAMNNWPGLAPWQDWYNASSFGVLQTPTEYVDYLLYAARRDPASCLEIGVHTGGLAVFSCAFFQARNPAFRYVGADIENRLLLSRELVAPLNLEFRIPCTSAALVGEQFDLVFIDGDHSYHWAKTDWLNVGRHARVCGFHDIHGREYEPKGGGAYTFWRQLRASLSAEATMLEFAHAPPGAGLHRDAQWMGIGVVDRTQG